MREFPRSGAFMHNLWKMLGTTGALGLTACSSLEGSPRQVAFFVPGFFTPGPYDVSTAINEFEHRVREPGIAQPDKNGSARDPQSAKAYRNKIIAIYMTAIDDQYGIFRRKLNSQRKGAGLGLTLASLGLNGASPLVGVGTKDVLSALAGGATSARISLDKELYFDQALPALLAAMDAERLKVKATLLERMRDDAANYSMSQAFIDLNAYQAAPSFERAIDKLTASASADRSEADTKVETAIRGCSTDDDLTIPRGQIMTALDNAASNNDTLKKMAMRVGVETQRDSVALTPEALIDAIQNKIRGSQCGIDEINLVATDFATYSLPAGGVR